MDHFLCVGWLNFRALRPPPDAVRRRVGAAASLECALRRRGVRTLGELSATALRSYAPPPRWSGSPPQGALVRSLVLCRKERGELAQTPPTPTECRVCDYGHYLEHVRGLAASTVAMHRATAREFLLFLDHDLRPERLHDLQIADIDAFLAQPLVARLATQGPTIRPLWYLWEDGAFWWLSGSWSRLPARLAADPRVALVVDTCDLATGEVLQVYASGWAETHPYDNDRAYRKLRRYLGDDETTWEPSFGSEMVDDATVLIRLVPERLTARDLSFRVTPRRD